MRNASESPNAKMAAGGSTRSAAFDGAPRLLNGDHLTVPEFERRYWAMPDDKRAELIEGIVCVFSTDDDALDDCEWFRTALSAVLSEEAGASRLTQS